MNDEGPFRRALAEAAKEDLALVARVTAWMDRHPVTGHAIVGAPFAFAATAWMYYFGERAGAAGMLFVITSIYAGVFTVLLAAVFQEWADQRAHDAIEEHHKYDGYPVLGTEKRAGDLTAMPAEDRRPLPSPEVWHGWDWRDFVGFAIGAQVGAVLAIVLM